MISRVIFAYGNLITPLSQVAASSSDPLTPAAYTASDFRGVMTSATGCVEESYTVTTGADSLFNAAAILGDNLTADGTIGVYGSNDNFATSDALVPDQPKQSAVSLFTFDLAGYAKTRFVLKDPTNPDAYIRFGKLFLGKYIRPSVNYAHGFSDFPVDLTTMVESQNFVPHFNEKPFRNESDLPFVLVPPEDYDLLRALWAAVGISRPFILAMDNDNDKAKTYYVRFAASPRPTTPVHQRSSYQLAFREGL